LCVDVAVIIRFPEIEFAAERELPIHEMARSGTRNVFALIAVLNPEPRFLTGAREGGPVKQVEIALRHLDEADN